MAEFLGWTLQPPIVWTSIDAGAGKMRARTARQRKNRGVKKGWPDILILAPGPRLLGIDVHLFAIHDPADGGALKRSGLGAKAEEA